MRSDVGLAQSVEVVAEAALFHEFHHDHWEPTDECQEVLGYKGKVDSRYGAGKLQLQSLTLCDAEKSDNVGMIESVHSLYLSLQFLHYSLSITLLHGWHFDRHLRSTSKLLWTTHTHVAMPHLGTIFFPYRFVHIAEMPLS